MQALEHTHTNTQQRNEQHVFLHACAHDPCSVLEPTKPNPSPHKPAPSLPPLSYPASQQSPLPTDRPNRCACLATHSMAPILDQNRNSLTVRNAYFEFQFIHPLRTTHTNPNSTAQHATINPGENGRTKTQHTRTRLCCVCVYNMQSMLCVLCTCLLEISRQHIDALNTTRTIARTKRERVAHHSAPHA